MKRVLISGAGIAGQVAAHWLTASGRWQCTVIERFGALRTGGQNVDIRGSAREVVRRMGLGDAVARHGTGEVGTRFVDDQGRTVAEFPEDGSSAGGATAEWEILRGQLTELLHDLTGAADYRFGTSIAAVADADRSTAVRVTFDDGTVDRFDAVIIAEGIGSRTRDLLSPAFGTVRRTSLGVSVGYFSIDRIDSDDDWWRWYFTAGGRSVTLRPDNVGRQRATLSFRTAPLGVSGDDPEEAKRILRTVFDGAGWQTPRIVAALNDVDDFYLDDLGQIHADRWTAGRVALVGDAACCPSPVTGMGTSLAIVGGHVLAGELAGCDDVPTALEAYERVMRPFVQRAQRLPPGAPGVMHPRTRLGVESLRLAFKLAGSGALRPFERRLFHPPADRFTLPEYPSLRGAGD